MRSFPVIGRTGRVGLLVVVAASLLPVATGTAADSEKSPESHAPKSAAATSTGTASAQPTGAVHAWPIHLQHLKPTVFVKDLLSVTSEVLHPDQITTLSLVPPTVQAIAPDDTNGTVIVQGDEAGVLKVMEMVRLLDVTPREVKLIVRFTRAPDADNPASFVQPVLAVAVTQVKNNENIDVSVFADHHLLQAHILPHINGDGSVSLATSLSSQATGNLLHDADASTEAVTRQRVVQSASTYVGPTWYHRFASIAPSDLRENGGKVDPANEKTISYGGNINTPGNIHLPPQGDYAVSVAPIVEPLPK